MYFRPLPILTIFTIPLLVILLLLGNWQWGRYKYKLKAETAPPAAFQKLEMAKIAVRDFQKYHLDAQIISQPIAIKTSENGKYGARFFAIAQTTIGKAFFEYGFISDEILKNNPNPIFPKQIKTDVVTRISIKKPNRFINDNIPATSLFYWVELKAMAQSLGIEIDYIDFYFTPINMDALSSGKTVPNPYADEKGATYVEPGRHLGYALTWWGLGISLIAVYVALHFTQNRFGKK